MATEIFKMDDRSLKKLIKIYEKFPAKFKRATAGMLNGFAFGTRKESLKVIRMRMTIRNNKFTSSRLRVDKAKGNMPINEQHSTFGSIKTKRHSGWVEQETGKQTQRTRTATLLGRGGEKGKAIRASNRLKPGKSFTSPDDFQGKNQNHRVIVMLQVLFRKRFRRPFIIKGSRKFKSGLYRIQAGKKLRMMQSFVSKNLQPKRIRWLTTGRKLFFRKTDIKQMWGDVITHVFKLKKR